MATSRSVYVRRKADCRQRSGGQAGEMPCLRTSRRACASPPAPPTLDELPQSGSPTDQRTATDIHALLGSRWESLPHGTALPQPRRSLWASWRYGMAVHSAWLVPLAACVVFVMLIFTALGVRRAIILLWTDSNDAVALAENGSERGAADGATKDSIDGAGRGGSLESSEPGYEVLPPLAAKGPGRTLPKMLLVGPHKQMFPSLSAGRAAGDPRRHHRDPHQRAARGGGCRAACQAEAQGRSTGDPRRPGIRACAARSGRPPDARSGKRRPTTERDSCGAAAFNTENGDIAMQRCTVTGGGLAVRNLRGIGNPLSVMVERCFMRGRNIRCEGPAIAVALRESGFIVGHPNVLHFVLDEQQSVTIEHCTFIQAYLLLVTSGERWPKVGLHFQMRRSLFGAFACCPNFVVLDLPESYPGRTSADAVAALRMAFREFRAEDNFACFFSDWWATVRVPGARSARRISGQRGRFSRSAMQDVRAVEAAIQQENRRRVVTYLGER